MPKFRILVDVNDVAEGDVTDLAQEIYDANEEAFDASHGDFTVRIVELVPPHNAGFALDWEPEA